MSMHICPHCDYQTDSPQSLNKHIHIQHIDKLLPKPCNQLVAPAKHYICLKCNKTYKIEAFYKNHIERCQAPENSLKCPYCFKEFSHKNNTRRHQATCKKAPTVIQNKTNIGNQTNTNIHIGNQTNIHIENQQIHINLFGQERLDHLSNEFIMNCIKNIGGSHHGITNMVEKIHFSPEVPENRNVRIKSTKQKQLEVMDLRGWTIKDKNDVISEMVFKIIQILNEYYKSDAGDVLRTMEEKDGEPYFLKNLIKMVSIHPQTHSPIYRQVYALILSYCRLMQNNILYD